MPVRVRAVPGRHAFGDGQAKKGRGRPVGQFGLEIYLCQVSSDERQLLSRECFDAESKVRDALYSPELDKALYERGLSIENMVALDALEHPVALDGKLGWYDELLLFDREELYPSRQLRWTHAILILGEKMNQLAIGNSLRQLFESSGIKVLSQELGDPSGVVPSLIEQQCVSPDQILWVVCSPDWRSYQESFDDSRSDPLRACLGLEEESSALGATSVLLLLPRSEWNGYDPSYAYERSLIRYNMDERSGFTSHVERSRLITKLLSVR